jgi:hypothetical protein
MATRSPSETIRAKQGEFSGTYSISGTVMNDGSPDAPVMRRVRLYDRYTGDLIQETWSDQTTGAYTFTKLPNDKQFTVISYDHTNYYNAVVSDNITPE